VLFVCASHLSFLAKKLKAEKIANFVVDFWNVSF
jgi:hypothetical protein